MTLQLKPMVVELSAGSCSRRVVALSPMSEIGGYRAYCADYYVVVVVSVVKWELLQCRCIVDVRYVVEKREMVG